MLALARHHSWKTEGYNRSGHPVQQRIKREISRWTGLAESNIVEGEDGCTAVTFALPLFNMALAMVRLAQYSGQIVAKVGAEGVYLAALPAKRLGIALKVEDGDALSAMVALVHVLDQLGLDPKPSDAFPRFAEPPVHNTRGIPVGSLRPMGGLEFK
jgi:L-asparaginase II